MPPRKTAGSTTTTTTAATKKAVNARPPRKSYVFDASLDVPSPGGAGFAAGAGAGGRGRNAAVVGGSVVTDTGRRRSSRLSSGSEASQATPPPVTAAKRKGKLVKKGADEADEPVSTSSAPADPNDRAVRDRLAMPPPPIPSSSSLGPKRGLAGRGVNGNGTAEVPVTIPDASLESSNNSLGSFDFTTQPFPTPGAPKNKEPASNAKRKRGDEPGPGPGGLAARNKRARMPAAPGADPSGDGEGSKSTPKSVHFYGSKDWNDELETSLPIAETPMQNKNREFRRGPVDMLASLGLGMPGSGGAGGSRRMSMERRGGRGSSIGNGFEATPHPSIDSSEFHRHINLSQPPPVRLRALVSWCAQRADLPSSTPAATDLIRKTVDGVVRGICESRIDVSWYGGPPATTSPAKEAGAKEGKGKLPPHPQNVKNERKIEELDLWEATMTYEDAARQSLLQRYRTFAAEADSSLEALSSLPRPASSTSSTAKLSFSLPEPLPSSSALSDLSSAIAYGRRIRENPVPAGWGETSAEEAARKDRRKSKGKGRASVAPGAAVEEAKDGDTVDVAKAIGPEWADVRSNTAALFSHAHELNQACRIAQTYTSQRLAAAHSALTDLRRQGQAGGIAAAMSGVATVNASEPGGVAGEDARDLLRAIAREDTKGRK